MAAHLPTPVPQEAGFFPEREHRRKNMRIALNRGGTVAADPSQGAERLAFVRDFNFTGIFFYADFVPELKSRIEVEFNVPAESGPRHFSGRGVVVRVERHPSGVAGIALRFERCNLCGV